MAIDEERLDDLLDQWEAAYENGRDVPVSELCRECPELIPHLEDKIARLKRLNGVLGDTQPSAVPRPADNSLPVENVCLESRFQLCDFIDEGGLGAVYVGYDNLLRRDAAIKFLRQPYAQQEDSVKQFKTECEITSRLDHPSVVPIYGHGTLENGQPYYVMRRIAGQTLAQRSEQLHQRLDSRQLASDQRLDFHSLLSYFVTVCRTIHYAHCRGVIHRDIKPANIMIGKHGETTVLDWGLAQMVERDELHQLPAEETLEVTRNAMVENSTIGTPIYMSPEQHEGVGATVQSDVYSLGATMFVLLAGQAPFQASSLPELKSKVMRGDTVKAAAKYRWLPRALVAICQKSMAVDPSQRYASALHLAKDVERYLADEPVDACPDTPIRRAGRWLSRHRYKAFVIATLLLAGVVGSLAYSTIVTGMARREHDALVEANEARVRSLNLAAGFAANSVALEMSDRWRILEIAAHDDKLIQMLQSIPVDNQDVDWPGFQGKLMQFKETYDAAAGEPDSWFLCDATGRQVARVKPSQKTIGQNYAHRDYFHGQAHDSSTNSGAEIRHIDDVHRSKVYLSSSSNQLKVALTRPIWSQVEVNPRRKFLGILGMSVSLGEFKALETDLDSSQFIMVVDTTENILNDQIVAGLFLHHPQLQNNQDEMPPVATPEFLQELLEVRRAAREKFREREGRRTHGIAQVVKHFRDPFADSSSSDDWNAAFSPVIIKGRPMEIADTGWGVIVAERKREL